MESFFLESSVDIQPDIDCLQFALNHGLVFTIY